MPNMIMSSFFAEITTEVIEINNEKRQLEKVVLEIEVSSDGVSTRVNKIG